MKPLSFLLTCCLLFIAAKASAQEARLPTGDSQPVLLCYAVTSSSGDKPQFRNRSVVTRQPDQRPRLISVESHNEHALSFPDLPPRDNDDPGSAPSVTILAGDLCYSKRPLPFSQMELQVPQKFSMENLMRGTVYDFKKENRLRLETGASSGLPTKGDMRYEEPFCVAFFLRFNVGGD